MNKLTLLVLHTALLSSCASVDPNEYANMWNVPSVTTSKFDGEITYSVNNISCPPLLFELIHKTSLKPDEIILLAKRPTISNIGDGESLKFNIDGQFTAFKSFDILTRHTTECATPDCKYGVKRNLSSKAYLVPRQFIQSLANGRNVTARLNGLQDFVVAQCSTEESQLADLTRAGITPPTESQSSQTGFNKFLQLIQR